MRRQISLAAAIAALAAPAAAGIPFPVELARVTTSGPGEHVGALVLERLSVGLMINADLRGLPPGPYRLRFRDTPSCEPDSADGAAGEPAVPLETVTGERTDHLIIAADGTDHEYLLAPGVDPVGKAMVIASGDPAGPIYCAPVPDSPVAVVGGAAAELGQAPYVVEIAWADARRPRWVSHVHVDRAKTALDDHLCGGTLVARDWVLTAAHCFGGLGGGAAYARQWVVRGGGVRVLDSDRSQILSGQLQVFPIDDIVIRPGYTPAGASIPAPPRNDLALLHLTRPAPVKSDADFSRLDYRRRMRERFAVLPLASRPYWPGEVVMVAGWGSRAATTGYSQVQQAALEAALTPQNAAKAFVPLARTLQVADLALVDGPTCAQAITRQFQLTGEALNDPLIRNASLAQVPVDLVCAGEASPSLSAPQKATCNGDSGGPLKAEEGSAELVAVVGWAVGCAQAPGVYTRITPDVASWIAAVTTRKAPPPIG